MPLVGRLRRFFGRYLKRYLGYYVLGVLCLVGTNALTVAIPGFVQGALDALAQTATDPTGPERAVLWAWAVLLAGVAIVVVRTLSRTLFFNPGRTVEFRLKRDLFDRLLELPRSFFDQMRPGEIISRGTNDSNAVRALSGFATLQLFNVILMLALTLGRMIALEPWLTLLCVIPLALSALVLRVAIRAMWSLVAESQRQIATLSDRILETYNGVAIVQAFGAEVGARARFDDANDRMLELGLGLARIQSWMLPIVGVVGSLCVVGVLLVGGPMVAAERLTVGALAAFIVYIQILVTGLTSLGWMVNSVQRGLVGLERVDDVLYATSERPPPTASMPEPGAHGYALEVEALSFHYPAAPEAQVLSDVSLALAPGEVLGIFGPTGSGKSTLLDVLARVYETERGAVRVDGQPAEAVPIRDWWRRVAYVTQEPFLFSRSIRENIVLADPRHATEEDITRALTDAAFESDLETLPEGLATIVGERGITLSGGQRQRVALARAFFRPFDLLLLDDVLSAVDHATEQRLIDAIYGRLGPAGARTASAIVVSHRSSVLARADRILVLVQGRIVDGGTHEELLTRPGPYREAWRLQKAREALESGRLVA